MNRDINIDGLDNLNEDTGLRDKICLEEKASLLVEAGISSRKWRAFMEGELTADRELKFEFRPNTYYCGRALE